jgi:hypothetical protein
MTEREAGTDYDAVSRASLELVSVFKETSRNFVFIFSCEGRLNIKILRKYTQKVLI